MSVRLSRLSFVGLYFVCVCVCVCLRRLSRRLFCRFEVTVSFNGAVRASQKHFTCLGNFFEASGSNIFVECFSSPNCKVSGLFGSGADRFVLVQMF